ncbi:hypothetical protein BZG36_03881 [Bifiguratus adelaidae]|uniref:GPI mannosyltransferase 2 n=1 Tax=Bifiguratus adelaidae TaxID=1938954 RepID=A0A261XXS3_9FUNG|nr:hypothetical protein BZG36_03881 [Bifiguratus adelaidae]
MRIPSHRIERHIVVVALLGRFFVFVLAALANWFVDDYDSSSSTLVSTFPLTVYLRWDAVYFLHIASQGYVYEQEHAFFPLVPVIARALATIILKPLNFLRLGDTDLTLLSGILVSNLAFVLAAVVLYRLTLRATNDVRFAWISSIFFCLNPAGIFMSSFYTESMFALLSFSGMYCWLSGKALLAAIVWSVAGLARSNAIIYAGFFCFDMATSLPIGQAVKRKPLDIVFRILKRLFCIAIVFGGFAIFQYYGYRTFCDQEHKARSGWCDWRLPLMYSHVQSAYWDNGFLTYWEMKQIPNFLFALPMICLSSFGILQYFQHDKKRFLSIGYVKTLKANASPYFESTLIPFIYLWLFLLIYCVFFMHVQVITRFFSSLPPVYWGLAYAHSLGRHKRLSVLYPILYGALGVVLFAKFFPPA